MAKCKRCGLKTVLNEDEINKMVEQVISMKGVRLVDEAVYASRIEICGECDKLEYGSTCMSCGCVMQVRARLRDGKCPLKKWDTKSKGTLK
jgi:ribosomal protein S26